MIVDTADPFLTLAKRGEELNEFLSRHSVTIVSYRPAVSPELFDSLPFDTKFYALGLGLKRVFEEFARPLIVPARLEHAVDEVRRCGCPFKTAWRE